MAKNEIQNVEPTAIQNIDPASPAGLMSQLMSKDGALDVEGFGKMLEFQERYEASQAKKVYASDFAVAQSKIEAVVKAKYNPQTKSNYAGIDDVIEMAKPVYTEQGFSIIYYEGETKTAEHIRVCVDVLHKAGHKETYHYDVPLGGVGIAGKVNMTKIHAKATSVTYGRRYLLCMIWNIPTQDDDGNAPGKKPPKVDPPSDEEWGYIDDVCNAMVCPEGMRADRKKVAAVCYELKQSYPHHENATAPVAKWLSEMDRPELFIPENRSDFEKGQDMPGDADSVPDTPEEATAQSKFGEEVVECRYLCNGCSEEFDEFKLQGVCPNSNCLGRDITDRRKS